MVELITFLKLSAAIFSSLAAISATLVKWSKTTTGGDFLGYIGNRVSSGINEKIAVLDGRVTATELRLDKGDKKMDEMISQSKNGDDIIGQKVDYLQSDVTLIKDCLINNKGD